MSNLVHVLRLMAAGWVYLPTNREWQFRGLDRLTFLWPDVCLPDLAARMAIGDYWRPNEHGTFTRNGVTRTASEIKLQYGWTPPELDGAA